MIKDRGAIKWTAMMLPEHVEMLRKDWKEDTKIGKPAIDEQALEEIELIIKEAKYHSKDLVITYWQDGEFKTVVGQIWSINENSKLIRVSDKFNDCITIVFNDLVDARAN
ncbi:YolD-like family protein [Schinkia azotoformans]|uniref:YolD-like family protein n=1 Tax=Schinkia azotoformans TaxID=1454 RepID=UPI002E1C495A|nr:YolD-like family protein [Schinkia azotoformans]